MVKHNDPKAQRGERDLHKQQANLTVTEQQRERQKGNRKRGSQKELPELRSLPPELAHRLIPAGLIQAGHEVVVKIVKLGVGVGDARFVVLPQKNGGGEVHALLDEMRLTFDPEETSRGVPKADMPANGSSEGHACLYELRKIADSKRQRRVIKIELGMMDVGRGSVADENDVARSLF